MQRTMRMRVQPALYPGQKPVRVPIRLHRVRLMLPLLQIRVPVMSYTRPLQP